MTTQQLHLRAVSDARRRTVSIALAASVAALLIGAMASAQAKQPCSAAAGSEGYWSWRIIDGRKCWYEGKPMLSKSLLEWPAQASALPADAEASSVPPAKRGDLMDAEAMAPDNTPTFEALWRSRVEKR